MISAPRPLLAPTYSATTAPTRLSSSATLSPLNTAGMAWGTRSFSSVTRREARRARNSSKSRAGVVVRPRKVFSNSGKKAIRAAMMILGVIPKPNQMTRMGARANLGRAWVMIT